MPRGIRDLRISVPSHDLVNVSVESLVDLVDDYAVDLAGSDVGHRKPRVLGRRDTRFDDARFIQVLLQEVPGSPDSEVGVVGDLQCASARAFRKATEGVRLHPPGNAPEKELLVIRPARFAEDITVLVFELPDGHVAQGLDLFPQGPLICWSLFS
ncbi:MAG TPA: hypothetical protein VMH81_28450 [Bryobacteraceae bacterium]|nr:hypothetical protein [Bryobacteraceae bacterium]